MNRFGQFLKSARLLWSPRNGLFPRRTERLAFGEFYALSLVLLALNVAYSEPSRSGEGNVEWIKKYLIEHPAIAVAVVHSRNDLMTLPGGPASGSVTPYVTFQGARENENFYVRQVAVDADENEPIGTNTIFMAGRADKIAWHEGRIGSALNSAFISQTTLSGQESLAFYRAESMTNTTAQFASIIGGKINRYLDLGLVDIKRGTFQFDGNKFKVELNRGVLADGELLVDGSLVTGIKFRIGRDKDCLVSEFTYGPTVALPISFPTKVVQKVYGDGGKLLRTNMAFEFLRHQPTGTRFLPPRPVRRICQL